MPASEEMPSTIRRSAEHARAIWAAAHDSAVEQYGEGARAHRTAFAALKHSFEKVGDHWEQNAQSGPSDERSKGNTRRGATHGGVDATATKDHLLDIARRLDIPRRSRMTKSELVEAIASENARVTRKASE